MNSIVKLALLMLAPVAVNAQPMAVDCANAIHTYLTYSQSYSEFVRKNAELLSQASVNESVSSWFEAPMASLQSEANRNFSKLKKGERKRNRCTLNYALYQTASENLLKLIARRDLHDALSAILNTQESRAPANFSSTLLATQERVPTELRSAKRKIGLIAQSLSSYQSSNCLEKMIVDGDLKALSDSEASETYAHYLNNYLQNGGLISSNVEAPLQMSNQTSLKEEASKALAQGDNAFAENLEALNSISSSVKVYLARKSFAGCPVSGTAAIKILVPSQISVTGLLGQSELVHEDASLWTSAQAVQYSDTKIENFASLVLKNKMSGAKTFFKTWVKESINTHSLAGN